MLPKNEEDVPSAIPQNPWSVRSGTYVRADGLVLALDGRDDFWSQHPEVKTGSQSVSVLCHSGKTLINELDQNQA
ncbi:hypothetical protein EK21DRAFT_106055 [Setomelanomma holmii]|uniref:Uncharacterized protein n=1 Tax=Setomelanomma holmii TaxID=210430 RepID=A0A9P4HM35_9PLEO|nr:hypothetical protein EK21DRAFT_106055 [Setomelanomma holmii]